jgi:hypothetical protein
MTIASILMPDWLSYSMTASTGITVTRNIGLHQSCNSVSDPPCRHFPAEAECDGEERSFCSMWRTTGFLMSLATVAELATIVGFLVIMGGGKLKREKGWRVLGALLGVVAAIQFASMAIVVSSSVHAFRILETCRTPQNPRDKRSLIHLTLAGLSVRSRRPIHRARLAPRFLLRAVHHEWCYYHSGWPWSGCLRLLAAAGKWIRLPERPS